MKRSDEIRRLLKMGPEELVEKSNGKLLILAGLNSLFEHFAESIATEIEENNKAGKDTKLILPVGPTGHYPLLKQLIHDREISLKDCCFFFMDEYCDDSGHALPATHPLSFKGTMEKLFFDLIDPELNIPSQQLFFPDQLNIYKIKDEIARLGGIDTCYGGIGIHGHVAFNEPEPNVIETDPRLVYLNDFTITINAVRAGVGGDLINFPRKALTIGMNQIKNAGRIRLYCRNGVTDLDWANTVLRLSVLGEPGEDYPVTLLNNHPDFKVITDEETAKSPEHIL